MRTVLNICHPGIEMESVVVRLEECRCFPGNNLAVTSGINNEVVVLAKLVEREILAGHAKNERACFGGESVLPVYLCQRCISLRLIWSYPNSTIQPPELPYHLFAASNRPQQVRCELFDPADSRSRCGQHFHRPLWMLPRRHPADGCNPCSRFRCR